MNIDERIERLVERHEALAESTQMLTDDVRQLTTEVRALGEMVGTLAELARNHETRLAQSKAALSAPVFSINRQLDKLFA
jgi:hypothetical protein